MARKNGQHLNGWINLDKPLNMGSTQALGAVKRFLNPKKAGHAGTLDPLATGILPIALGDATKLVNFAQDSLKTYEFTVTWGERRDTDDAEGEVIATSDVRPSIEEIIKALPSFLGEVEQIPPKYSALKINGQRAYDLARAGLDVEMEVKARMIYIEQLNLLSATEQTVSLECVCGKGTYVRAIARDLAHMLSTEGYITNLRRTAVGPFHEKNAVSLDFLEKITDKAELENVLLPLETVLDDIPALALTQAEATRLRNGNALSFVSRVDFGRLEMAGINTEDGDIAAAIYNDQLIALVEVTGPRITPTRVFHS
ncbi:MAG: tRNA pseudouridine(55) synthase TruB [Rhodospirillales bacterium]|nr:tRNA pseudouridine(55) synthase TruB [Rhodospirillales bacterium]